MKKRSIILQLILVVVLFSAISYFTYLYIKSTRPIPIEDGLMKENGMLIAISFILGIAFIIYTSIYVYNFINSIKGRRMQDFHKFNIVLSTGAAILSLLIILFNPNKIVLIIISPLLLLSIYNCFTSMIYLKD